MFAGKSGRSAVLKASLIAVLICSYTASAALYASDSSSQKLYLVDQIDASVTEVGAFGVEGYMAGLAYDANHGIMYGVTTASDKLFSISLSTGAATLVGDLNATLMHGLAYDNSTDTLFGTYGSSFGNGLYQIDVSTGHSTLIGNMGQFPNSDTIGGLAIHPVSGDLYGVLGGPASGSGLVKIDKNTGAAMLVHSYAIQILSGLAFDTDGVLYATDNWSGDLYTLDISSGATSLVGNTGLDNALGLAAIPEPATMVFFISASVLALFIRRRFLI